MSGLPIQVDLPDEVLEQIARRVADLLLDQAPEADPWLNVTEAAEHCRCSTQRIYDLKSQGRLQAGQDGTRVLFRRSTLDAYLER